MRLIYQHIILTGVVLALLAGFTQLTEAQNFQRELAVGSGGTVEIFNHSGRVRVETENAPAKIDEKTGTESAEKPVVALPGKSYLSADSDRKIADSEIKITNLKGILRIEVAPADVKKRIDLSFRLPERIRLKIETNTGEAIISGNFEAIEVLTQTGTIAADVPLENVRYDFLWTESRPRFLSDVQLRDVKEKAAGKFVVSGRLEESEKSPAEPIGKDEPEDNPDEPENPIGQKPKQKNQKPKSKNQKSIINNQIILNFTTARGIILLNVPLNQVSSDLSERPLTRAAKSIISSGDSLLTEAIRRASPKYFGDYAKTLPPVKREPVLTQRTNTPYTVSQFKKVLVSVTDINNRAIPDLKKEDFSISESGEPREVLLVEPSTAPFNLVLLLDVSGSVDNYVNFIRKAARSFVNTVDKKDRIAVIIFNDDVQVISNFTTDKTKISESLDTFEAGGSTAYYDAIGYTLTETLRPLKGERTAIVVLTDGDDNRSFLPFESLLGTIQESGALIYPLYVPTSLAAAANNAQTVDPLRTKYLGLTSKAEGEGEKLAKISGGVYYPITQLDELQKAYDDIVLQLRTAYTVTFRSDLPEAGDRQTASPRLKIRVKRENSFIKLGSVTAATGGPDSQTK